MRRAFLGPAMNVFVSAPDDGLAFEGPSIWDLDMWDAQAEGRVSGGESRDMQCDAYISYLYPLLGFRNASHEFEPGDFLVERCRK